MAWNAGLRLVLASGSPQRREILSAMGVPFAIDVPGVDEIVGGDPLEVALNNARLKARAVGERHYDEGTVVLAADTVVAVGERILDKPSSAEEARDSIAALAGRSHEVHGGVVLAGPGDQWREATARSTVTFRALTPSEIADYVETGEWEGRAGGYAIQLRGAGLVEAVEGDSGNVIGLSAPLLATLVQGLVPDGGPADDRYNPWGRGSSFSP